MKEQRSHNPLGTTAGQGIDDEENFWAQVKYIPIQAIGFFLSKRQIEKNASAL
jgi:hypothetical protein